MDEDEEMWFNDDEDDFESSQSDSSANGSVSQTSQAGGDATKIKSCFVSLKLCTSQNGPAESDSHDSDAKSSPKKDSPGNKTLSPRYYCSSSEGGQGFCDDSINYILNT